MARTSRGCKERRESIHNQLCLYCVSTEGSSVFASASLQTQYGNMRYYGTIRLQTYEYHKWRTVTTARGYFDYYSPMHREFKNIDARKGSQLRVIFEVDDYFVTSTSNTWIY